MDERGRSTEEILRDIAREEESLSRTAQQIGNRIKEKLDWKESVKDSPYWALGIAAGAGFFATRMMQPRTTPMERIMNSLAGEVRNSLGGLHVGAAPNLAKVTLLGIGTKFAAEWMRNAFATCSASDCVTPPSQTEDHATIYPNATM